jgi:tRNA-dihydrouridine synthase
MIGRGIFQNPWIFNKKIKVTGVRSEDKIKLAIRHIKLFKEFWGDERNYDNLKKFYKIYISGWDGAKALRTRLMNTKNAQEASSILLKSAK